MDNFFCFDNFDQELQQAGSYIGAAEMHGLQTGMICADHIAKYFSWESALLVELDCLHPSTVLVKNLRKLYAHTTAELYGFSVEFSLLLPPATSSLKQRAIALAQWCRGFICGLALAGVQANSIKAKVAKEAIKDLSQIAHLDLTDIEIIGDQERYFSELADYVKLAVYAIRNDLSKTLHSNVGSQMVH